MIDLRKAEIFLKYGGNIDAWLQEASHAERSAFSEGDWSLIESILDELCVLNKIEEQESQLNKPQVERIYTPMTKKQHEAATAEAERFAGRIEKSEYEATLEILWKCV